MFESQVVQPPVFRGARRIQKRRVALAQGSNPVIRRGARTRACRVETRLDTPAVKGQQFPVTPNTALVQNVVRGTTLPPSLLPMFRIRTLSRESYFEQRPAGRAIVDRFGDWKTRATLLLKADQLR